jgi:hypothetical protein
VLSASAQCGLISKCQRATSKPASKNPGKPLPLLLSNRMMTQMSVVKNFWLSSSNVEAAAKAKAAEEEARFKIARQKRDAEYEIRKTKWDAESDYKRRLEEAIKKAEERRVNELSFQAAEWKKQEERLRDQHRQRIYELEREWLRKCVKYRN